MWSRYMTRREILIRETLRSKSRATIYGNVAYKRTKRKSVAEERETAWRPSFNLDTLREIARSRSDGLRSPLPLFGFFIANDRASLFKERSLARTAGCNYLMNLLHRLFKRMKQFIFDGKISNYSCDRKQFI